MRSIGSAALAAATLLWLAAPASAQPQTVTAIVVADVAAHLDGMGLRSQERTDDQGRPYLDVALTADMPGEQMQVIFYDCDGAGACADMRLWSWFSLQTPADVAMINRWNSEQRWSKAYLDADNDPNLEMDIRGSGGIGPEALQILINTYVGQMSEFAALIGYR